MSEESLKSAPILYYQDNQLLFNAIIYHLKLKKSLILFPPNLSENDYELYLKSVGKRAVHTDTIFDQNEVRQAIEWDSNLFGVVVFTSGSTGAPKAIYLPVRSLYYSALGSTQFFNLDSSDHFLATLPITQVGGLMVLIRATILKAPFTIFEKENLFTTIKNVRPSVLSFVPTQLKRAIEQIDQGDDKLLNILANSKLILIGGAPLSLALHKRALDLNLPISISYGMTEGCATICATKIKDKSQSGIPLPYRKIKIDSDGRVMIGGDSLYAGELCEGHFIKRAGEFFKTSDVGHFDELGALQIKGRADQIFISGGKKISPDEVESSTYALGDFQFVKLIATPDEEFGEVGTLFVDSGDPLQIKNLLKKSLAAHKVPKRVVKINQGTTKKPTLQELTSFSRSLLKTKRAYFIHGFMGTSNDLEFLYSTLTDLDIEPIALTLPFHSNGPTSFHNLEDYLSDLIKKIHPDKRSTLIGYSMGGRVALMLLKRAPHLFSSAIILSAHPGIEDEQLRKSRKEADQDLLSSVKDRESYLNFLTKWYSNPIWGLQDREELKKRIIKEKIYNPNYQNALSLLSVGNMPPLYDFLATTRTPILYVAGEFDQKYLEVGNRLKRENPKSEICVQEGIGHAFIYENKGSLCDSLYKFLTSI